VRLRKGRAPEAIALDDLNAKDDEQSRSPPARRREDDMAKGQVKGNKEAKKPKADKPKGPGSAYKQSQGKGGQALIPQPVKKT